MSTTTTETFTLILPQGSLKLLKPRSLHGEHSPHPKFVLTLVLKK